MIQKMEKKPRGSKEKGRIRRIRVFKTEENRARKRRKIKRKI
jgi:hypothetical protein